MSYKSDDIIIGFIRLVGVGDKWLSDIQAFIRFFGETFISAGIISLIMSIHTIQETHQKVRDNLLLEDPSFVERYTEEETDKLLNYSVQQKLLLNINTKYNDILDTFAKDLPEAFLPIFQYTVERLGECKFYCEKHQRNIKIVPVRSDEYDIEITFDVVLFNLTQDNVTYKQLYRLIYISQKQIDSFELKSLKINGRDESLSSANFQRIVEEQPATQGKPFKYLVSFEIPISISANGQCHYVLEYKYKSFSYGCLITYSLPFVTRQYQEVYSLVGSNAKKYHLQVLAYSPFTRNHLNNQDLVQKDNDQTYSINVNNWSLPGTGFAAVVRKKET